MYTREKVASGYILLLTIVGWFAYGYHLFHFSFPKEDIIIFLSLVLILGIIEYARFPIGRITTSIGFPILFTIDIVYGLSTTIVVYGLILTIINVLLRRPLRVVLYNPAQIGLAFILAKKSTEFIASLSFFSHLTILEQQITLMALLVVLFTLFNNIFIDVVFIIRPDNFPIDIWRQKLGTAVLVAAISFLYCLLLLVLDTQDRGVIDVLSYIFFFSPLLGLSLLSTIIVRLQKEKTRLSALVAITTDINESFASNEWIEKLKLKLFSFLHADAAMFVAEQDGKWEILLKENIHKDITVDADIIESVSRMPNAVMYSNKKSNNGPFKRLFPGHIQSIIYAPLKIESNVVGMLVLGKTRTHSFRKEDVQILSTLANQLAIILKTRKLISEQEKHMILQERNRIARDMHDGIAQSIAGAVLNLETAKRKYATDTDSSFKLISTSVEKLRDSLKEVRQSIYALRPYLTEKIGLKQAIEQHISNFSSETTININYEERGAPFELHTSKQKLIFDILKESLQNIKKHSQASNVEVLLSYQTEHVLLKVQDNGIGFSLFEAMLKARQDPHFGILNMNEQAERCGAVLQIDSKGEKGSIIKCIVPKMEIEEGDNNGKNYAG